MTWRVSNIYSELIIKLINLIHFIKSFLSLIMKYIYQFYFFSGWHHAFRSKAGAKVAFYDLIDDLYCEGKYVNIQVEMVSLHKLRRMQRKLYLRLQGKLFALWTDLKEGRKSTEQVLRGIGRLYGNMDINLEEEDDSDD